MKNRKVYLDNLSFDEAERLLAENFTAGGQCGTEKIPVYDALGRVSAAPVSAVLSAPNHNASAMDGIAVKAADTAAADERNHLRLEAGKTFSYVDTGDPVPEGFDAVIMVEDLLEASDQHVVIKAAARPWQHVRPVGEDISAGEMIIPSFHRLRAVDIGAVTAGGLTEIEVFRRPRVAIIPTGTEIIEDPSLMSEGGIIDSNSRMFAAMVAEAGCIPLRRPPVVDDKKLISEAFAEALEEADAVILGAGSSAGSEDYSAEIIGSFGELLFHGLAVKPGKPAIFGRAGNKPLIGLPGYPVSGYVVFDRLVVPLLKAMQGIGRQSEVFRSGTLSRRLVSSLEHREFVRVKCGYVGGRMVVSPLGRGAGITMSLVQADGIVEIPQNCEGYEAGEEIEVRLTRPASEIDNRLVSIGSHDLMLDILAEELHKSGSRISLSSTHQGSMGGVMALKKGECHIAPVHLLDPVSGLYNEHLSGRYFGGDAALVKGVGRLQGLMVRPGNPLAISGISDLSRPGLRFVNRQKGAGTRVLLEYLLSKEGIDGETITGWEREMTTHMAVASAVKSGTADAGLGVYSAAKLSGLEFIPVGREAYDFLVRMDSLQSGEIAEFIGCLKSQAFRAELETLGGYDFENTGEVIARDASSGS